MAPLRWFLSRASRGGPQALAVVFFHQALVGNLLHLPLAGLRIHARVDEDLPILVIQFREVGPGEEARIQPSHLSVCTKVGIENSLSGSHTI